MTTPGPAIAVESLGKRYQLGVTGDHHQLSLRIGDALTAPLRRLRGTGPRVHAPEEHLWALRDVGFEIQPGEVVGLVGPNGAGKSTLLKLLSRITPPTEGRIVLNGRLGSLLEVGTGFHPELTGRENIFLNGAVLGMTQREIAAQFDEIVEFSGVERFLGTPVKRYSSGMYVRLAFAVAAHLRPEILLVDEVLAVGDAEFQRKCLGKMEDVSHEGRTIVFVSHNLGAVRRLCPRSLLIQGGRLVQDGPSDQVIATYLREIGQSQSGGIARVPASTQRSGTGTVKLTTVALLDANGAPTNQLHFREPVALELTFEVERPLPDAVVQVGISSADGSRVVTVHNTDGGRPPLPLEAGTQTVRVAVEAELLPGDFTLDVAVLDSGGMQVDYLERVLSFTTLNAAVDGGDLYPWSTVRGMVRTPSSWAPVDTPVAAPGMMRP